VVSLYLPGPAESETWPTGVGNQGRELAADLASLAEDPDGAAGSLRKGLNTRPHA
jgi:hypothetical protein